MSMSKTIIVGHLGNDATIRETNGNKAIGFNVAVSRKYVNSDGEPVESTTWFNCTKWVYGKGSTEVAKYLKKGTLVSLVGEIGAHAYKNSEGVALASLDLKVETLNLESSAKSE